MRVAQLTLNVFENYGNILQKYALQSTLNKYADFVEVIWHCQTNNFLPSELEIERFKVGNLRDAAFNCVRQNKFKEFNDKYIPTRFDVTYIEDIGNEYDFFVVGSDQVWNPEFYFPGRFLDFAAPKKRIAYAASIAIPELPKNFQAIYRQKISEIPHVSMREKEGCDLVEKLTGKRPIQVLDPVFLLTAQEWRKISVPPTWINQKTYRNGYLLTYFFNGKPPEQVKSLAKKLNLPLINLFDINTFNHYIIGVEEFLYLVDHAALICTQSFHGTAFSTIFKRPFILYVTKEDWMEQKFSRIQSLLDLFDLNEQKTVGNLEIKLSDPFKINYARRDKILPLEREKSFKFLTEAFGL